MGKGKTVDPIIYNVELPPPITAKDKFPCNLCDKKFSKPYKLKVHQFTHSNERPYKCSVEGCSSAYFRPNHLKRHEENQHSKQGEFRCPVENCEASFETKESLHYHDIRKHQTKSIKCSYCPESFVKKFTLKEHEATHTGDKPFKCPRKACEERFSSHVELKAHRKMHLEDLPSYKCSEVNCDKVFTKWSELLAHRDTHPDSAVRRPCPVCNKMFSKPNLRQHQKIHEKDQDKVAFCCPHDGCPRFYFHVRNLTHHVRMNHEDLKFECLVCKKKISSKQKLDYHMKIIHENPPAPKIKSVSLKSNENNEISRKRIIKLLSGEKDLDVKRTGPLKGSKRRKISVTSTVTSLSCQPTSAEADSLSCDSRISECVSSS